MYLISSLIEVNILCHINIIMTENKKQPFSKYLTHTVTHEAFLEEQLHLRYSGGFSNVHALAKTQLQSLLEGISEPTEMCQFN